MEEKIKDSIMEFVFFILLCSIVLIIVGFPIMWLWNWLCPDIFGLPEISFWKAIGLSALIGIMGRIFGLDKRM